MNFRPVSVYDERNFGRGRQCCPFRYNNADYDKRLNGLNAYFRGVDTEGETVNNYNDVFPTRARPKGFYIPGKFAYGLFHTFRTDTFYIMLFGKTPAAFSFFFEFKFNAPSRSFRSNEITSVPGSINIFPMCFGWVLGRHFFKTFIFHPFICFDQNGIFPYSFENLPSTYHCVCVCEMQILDWHLQLSAIFIEKNTGSNSVVYSKFI